jgi:putative chitinase
VSDITVATLVAAGVPPTQARQFADPLAAACALFDISTPARRGGLVGQLRVESENFTVLEENLCYRSADRIASVFGMTIVAAQSLVGNPEKLANVVYANRMGNGDRSSGDGWKYHGRGLIQITGRDNYRDAAVSLARPYDVTPELVAQPSDACLVAAWFWSAHNCNMLADAGLWDSITKAINGRAMLQAEARSQYSQDAARAFA